MVRQRQAEDPHLRGFLERGQPDGEFRVAPDGELRFRGRICVPDIVEVKDLVLAQAHKSRFAMHPGANKMYQDLKGQYWWRNMKRDVAGYVARCLTCQRVKAEHMRTPGLMQRMPVPERKWENITMDFVMGLPRSPTGRDTVWVIVDRLTKAAHFLAMPKTLPLHKMAELYTREVVRLHGVPVSIISDRDARFTSHFWRALQQHLGTELHFSTAFHPQTDGQSERTIQTLEDMLRASVLDFGGSWERHLHLAEFVYNNSYHSTIGMAPFEALYGQRCRSPIFWDEVGQRGLVGPQILEEDQQRVRQLRRRLLTAQSRQKSYADVRRRDLEFAVGDRVFLKVSPTKGVMRFGRKGKLSPRFIGPYEVLERIGGTAYRLALPPALADVHDVFHVSMLRRYVHDPSHVLDQQSVQLQADVSYIEQPVRILDRKERNLRNRQVRLVKVGWASHSDAEATWEEEDDMRRRYPQLFEGRQPDLGDQIP